MRYYLDFCKKYNFKQPDKKSLTPFIDKLKEKKQSKQQQKQAVDAISLLYGYYSTQNDKTSVFKNKKETISSKKEGLKLTNSSWVPVYNDLNAEIRIRHYSNSTLRTYTTWIRQFQGFTKSKDFRLLSSSDVKEFLSHLAVNKKVAASTQNQAFNALLFFFRNVLKREFGELKDVPRAKKKPYIPSVLSREEVDTVIACLKYPYSLVVKLMYGCGLRLFECMQLRINDFNFETGILTVHDGKGKKEQFLCLKELSLN